MVGVLVNSAAVILGALIGLLFKKLISERISQFLETTLGVCTLIVGLKMAFQFENVLVLISCLGIGGLIGTVCSLEDKINIWAKKLQTYFVQDKESRFAMGLTTCSIIFCVGGMAILGPINSAAAGNHEVLFTKSILDGTFTASLASIYGIGTAFSAIPLFLYQGGIALLASKLQFLQSPQAIHEISGVGGALVMMIGINLSKLGKIPIGNYLPSMLLVILISFFL